MIEPQSTRLDLRDPPRISQESLRELRRFIAVVQAGLDAAKTSTAKDGGGA